MDPSKDALRASYDAVAEDYAARFWDELRHKPLDRALLAAFAERLPPGPVADLGCGPGQVTRYLHDLGVPALGIDLSPGMVALARERSPGIEFREGSMLALDAADGAWAGIVAFYSLIHLEEHELPRALAEFQRVLRPGGLLLAAFHIGREVVHADEMLGRAVSLDFHFLDPDELERALEAAGLGVEARLERRPHVAVEHPSRRGYLLASKPAPPGG